MQAMELRREGGVEGAAVAAGREVDPGAPVRVKWLVTYWIGDEGFEVDGVMSC